MIAVAVFAVVALFGSLVAALVAGFALGRMSVVPPDQNGGGDKL